MTSRASENEKLNRHGYRQVMREMSKQKDDDTENIEGGVLSVVPKRRVLFSQSVNLSKLRKYQPPFPQSASSMSDPKRPPLRRGDVLTVVLDDQLIEALERMHQWQEGGRCYEGNATQWTFDDKQVVDALLDVYRAEKRAGESQ